MKFYSLPRGILRETTTEIKQNFDLKKWLKKMLTLFNVPFVDPCCENPDQLPVGMGEVGLQYFDGTTWNRVGVDQLTNPTPYIAQQSLSGAGAISVATYYTAWTTTAANAGTLADGDAGQLKKITLVVDGGDGTLTPANLAGGTTITFDTAGDYVVLYFDGTDWVVVENSGTTIA